MWRGDRPGGKKKVESVVAKTKGDKLGEGFYEGETDTKSNARTRETSLRMLVSTKKKTKQQGKGRGDKRGGFNKGH